MTDTVTRPDAVGLTGAGWSEYRVPGFSDHVGPFWSRMQDSSRRFAFLVERHHLNGNGVVHGGMLMTFMDQAIGMTVWQAIGRKPCATIQLNVHFVAGARLGDLIEAEPAIVRETRSVIFTSGVLRRGADVVMSADGIWKVLHAKTDAPPPNW